MRRYHVTTFGCQMNVHDSERIKGMLEGAGLGEAPDRDAADVLVFNTCTIREKADDRLVQHLHDARGRKERDPDLQVVVAGCWAESQREAIFREFPWVDAAVGPGRIGSLADAMRAEGDERGAFGSFDDFAAGLPRRRERDFQAWLQLSMGCNSVCSYCIVPSVRGRERSRHPHPHHHHLGMMLLPPPDPASRDHAGRPRCVRRCAGGSRAAVRRRGGAAGC